MFVFLATHVYTSRRVLTKENILMEGELSCTVSHLKLYRLCGRRDREISEQTNEKCV